MNQPPYTIKFIKHFREGKVSFTPVIYRGEIVVIKVSSAYPTKQKAREVGERLVKKLETQTNLIPQST